MKKYFIQIRCNNPKNKAQDEFQKFGMSWNNCMCDELGLKYIIKSIKKGAKEINAKHKRYTAISIYQRKYYVGSQIFSVGIDSKEFHILSVFIKEVKTVLTPFDWNEDIVRWPYDRVCQPILPSVFPLILPEII